MFRRFVAAVAVLVLALLAVSATANATEHDSRFGQTPGTGVMRLAQVVHLDGAPADEPDAAAVDDEGTDPVPFLAAGVVIVVLIVTLFVVRRRRPAP